jgi:hypothetical protein
MSIKPLDSGVRPPLSGTFSMKWARNVQGKDYPVNPGNANSKSVGKLLWISTLRLHTLWQVIPDSSGRAPE